MSAIFIFRRDLRLHDNTALLAAIKENLTVYPIFIFDPRQVVRNPLKSNNCIKFMIDSLAYLNTKIKINYFYGIPSKVLEELLNKKSFDAVYVNRDYTDFAIERDLSLKKVCQKFNVKFKEYHDILLLKHGEEKELKVYRKFTPFYEYYHKDHIDTPLKLNSTSKIFDGKLSTSFSLNFKDAHAFYVDNPKTFKGGRDEGIKILRNIPKRTPFLSDKSTRLSAYLKFGCVSIREAYHAFKSSELRRQLFWREFYYQVYPYYKDITRSAVKPAKKWATASTKDKLAFKKWCAGMTGIPLVDAGMREMLTTGFMHNRARLNVANFLVKILKWYWKEGEFFFAKHLIDYDVIQNNGNWQWVAGTGTDSQPYFRIFNPILQLKKYDPDCEYVKKWIPELKKVPAEDILNWQKKYKEYPNVYCRPLITFSM